MIRAPQKIPATVPMPPASAVPPSTAAATIWSSSPSPARALKVPARNICMTATNPTAAPTSMKHTILIRSVLMPMALAASLLSPVTYTQLPTLW